MVRGDSDADGFVALCTVGLGKLHPLYVLVYSLHSRGFSARRFVTRIIS